MSDYRIECATKEEWAERCMRAEEERDRLRAALHDMHDCDHWPIFAQRVVKAKAFRALFPHDG